MDFGLGAGGRRRAVRPKHKGHLELFRNYDEYGNRLSRMNTLLIDSQQLESGEALDSTFREMAAIEIEQFKREKAEREGAADAANIPKPNSCAKS